MRPSLKFNEGKQGQGKVLISSLLKRSFATDLKKKTQNAPVFIAGGGRDCEEEEWNGIVTEELFLQNEE